MNDEMSKRDNRRESNNRAGMRAVWWRGEGELMVDDGTDRRVVTLSRRRGGDARTSIPGAATTNLGGISAMTYSVVVKRRLA